MISLISHIKNKNIIKDKHRLKLSQAYAALMEEKEDISHEAERLTIEKNDYLGRLRAISGVIDIVGTEKLVDESQSVQEFIPRQQPTIIR